MRGRRWLDARQSNGGMCPVERFASTTRQTARSLDAVMVDQDIDHDAGVPIADTPVVRRWTTFAAKPEAFDKPRRSHVVRMDPSFDSMSVECARTVVEDRPHSFCPEAASLVLRSNYVAQLKASVVGVSVVIGDHTNTSTV